MPDLQTILLIIIASAVAPKAVLFVMQFVPMPPKLAEAVKKLAANGNGKNQIDDQRIADTVIAKLQTNHFEHLARDINAPMQELTKEFRDFAGRQIEHSILEMEILRDIKENTKKY